MLLGLIPAALVMAQPDLGSALVYVVVTLAVLFVAGAPVAALRRARSRSARSRSRSCSSPRPRPGVDGAQAYQMERLTAFLHPSDNPADEGYQQNQSRIAIGSGEKTGRGDRRDADEAQLPARAPHRLHLRRRRRALGLRRRALVLSLYALLIWRGLRILTMAKNLFGALIAGGIVAMLLFQVFVNVGMNVGIMPITGIPLPLMSYGGSSVHRHLPGHRPPAVDLRAGRATAAARKGRVLVF